MKRLAFVATAIALAIPAARAGGVDVNVSIGFSQPGAYGRVDIGRYAAPPVLVAAAPMWVAPPPMPVRVEPVYLWVPRPHRIQWSRYCSTYHACAAPVYFVQDRWYRESVMAVPRGRPYGTVYGYADDPRDDRHGHGRGRGHHRGRDDD